MAKQLPEAFLQSLDGLPGFDRSDFERVHQAGLPVTSVRYNPAKWDAQKLVSHFNGSVSNPWTQYGFYLPVRPSFTFDPLFHAGCYYVQEASSMFLEQAMQQLADLSMPLKVLDISAAPGGKSTHLQSLLSADSLLVSNEVIRARSKILIDNIIKWGAANVVVTNNDPAHFKKLTGYFDVLVVDAPCSGSGLFRKDPAAIEEWSVSNVTLCSERQQRILADILPCLKEGGLLVYSTCSYSIEEDEAISDWLVAEMGLQNERLTFDDATGIIESHSLKTGSQGYRFYPHRVKGEGFFLACFRKSYGEAESRLKPHKWEQVSAKEKAIVDRWLQSDEVVIKDRDTLYALPSNLADEMALIQAALHVSYKGVRLGQIMKDKLVPDHALALSQLLSNAIPATALSYEQAIKYLQRQDMTVQPENLGWQTVTYQNQRLGWINALSNRINNYYPKESRILKQTNDRSFEK